MSRTQSGVFHTPAPPHRNEFPAKLSGFVVEKLQIMWPFSAFKAKTWPLISYSPPDRLTVSLPCTNCGALLMDKCFRKSATRVFDHSPPAYAADAPTSLTSRPQQA